MQLGGPLGHLHLELVPGCAKLFLCLSPLVDQAGILKGRRGLIRSKREQHLFDRGRKIAAFACGSDQPAVAVDTNWEGNRAARLGVVADVGNDRLPWELNPRGGVIFKPFRKPLPCAAACDVDCSSAIGIAQTHEGKVELQQRDEGVGESGCHARGFPPGPRSRDRRQRDEIPQRRLQAEELSVGVDVHLVPDAGTDGRLLLP
jgi:hypothetical protein